MINKNIFYGDINNFTCTRNKYERQSHFKSRFMTEYIDYIKSLVDKKEILKSLGDYNSCIYTIPVSVNGNSIIGMMHHKKRIKSEGVKHKYITLKLKFEVDK